MGFDFEKECNVEQGFNFRQDEHHTFGYINGLVIGDSVLAPDLKVAEPTGRSGMKFSNAGAGGTSGSEFSNIFTKPVAVVLSKAKWNTAPTDIIEFEGRVSAANMQLVSMLRMQALAKIIIQLSFVIYEYDPVNNDYFDCFSSLKGFDPIGTKPAKVEGAFGPDKSASFRPINGLLAKEGQVFQLTVEHKPSEDGVPGQRNYNFTIKVAPCIAQDTQQIKMQTSVTNKLVKGFGLPNF